MCAIDIVIVSFLLSTRISYFAKSFSRTVLPSFIVEAAFQGKANKSSFVNEAKLYQTYTLRCL